MGMMAFFVVTVYPAAFAGAPRWAQPLVTSPLVLATLVALVLNLLFRIGIRRKVELTIDGGARDLDKITSFIERNAGIWGARRDVANRVEFAVQQTIEAVVSIGEVAGPIRFGLGFDEFVIDVLVTYDGAPLEFPMQPPTHEEITETEHGHLRLAGYLIRRQADRTESSRRNGRTVVRLLFDH
jgi:NCS2 family nucleobase:cation symporter-2